MKKLPLKNSGYQYLEQGFKEWLDILGYAPSTVYQLPIHIREFFHFLEHKGVVNIQHLTTRIIKEYYKTLRYRTNKTHGGALSNAYLNKHLQALYKFMDYLRQSGKIELSYLNLKREEIDTKNINSLSVAEIKELYKASDKHVGDTKNEALASRDKVLLTIFYGCGLRRNEGFHLDLSDINFDTKIIHVRKGKNYKERLIPINKANLKIIEDYVFNHRPYFRSSQKQEALFISMKGNRMQGQSLAVRLKLLQQRSDDITLNQKDINLHLLRHSIATHLLGAGMSLEKIACFLGHSSLESTQIYTHLLETTANEL